jgi:alpha-mannosidase
MLKHRKLTHDRVAQLLWAFDKHFWRAKIPLNPMVSARVDRITYEEAMRLHYSPIQPKQELGPRFATYWFKVEGQIPVEWRDQKVDLIFNAQSEATVWVDGKPSQGINPAYPAHWPHCNRYDFRLPSAMVQAGHMELAIEVSCNHLWGAGGPSDFRFEEASLALFDAEGWAFYHDLYIPSRLLDLRMDKTKLNAFEGFLISRLNEICNRVDPDDRTTWSRARPLFDEIYAQKNPALAVDLSVIGHAHIDTAWLWPLAETRRKCMRSFSSALKYMEEYPEYIFACSQAFQYEWMKSSAPAIYEGIREAVKRGQWVPVGGTWIEPDCSLPSGESLVRQFLYGKRFFRQEFGWDCKEFWNPDVFGYAGQLPQIMKLSGIDYFLTQKLSWNQFNKPQHQNFLWKGIDGTAILTHFPPNDTYNSMDAENAVQSIKHSEDNHQDLDRTREGIMLYGWGDGGGGPTRHMLEVLRRTRDFQGLPRAQHRSSLEFFKRLESSISDLPVIEGELYLEYHRGTYTTQAANKRDNRAAEHALRRLEILAVLASREGLAYPSAELERLWKLVLLNQFHDILPGSSIAEVYQDSAWDYVEVLSVAAAMESRCLAQLSKPAEEVITAFNPLGWSRKGPLRVEKAPTLSATSQETHDGGFLIWAEAPALGFGPCAISSPHPVCIEPIPAGFRLENEYVLIDFNREGSISRMLHKPDGREVFTKGNLGNQFVMFDDRPNAFDAWDVDAFHLETRKTLSPALSARIVESGPLRVGLEFAYAWGPTSTTQRVYLAAGTKHLEFETEIDWQNRHQFLKVEFPVNVSATHAVYESPFGLARRPTTFNNSYEMAQFEVPGHRWMDLSETDFGVALFTDSKYGYACHRNVMRLSLLRGPTDPDPNADRGWHRFRYAIYAHEGDYALGQVVRRAHEFNQPLLAVRGEVGSKALFSLDSPHLVIDTIKKAEDSDDMIVRIYECHGARGASLLTSVLPFRSASKTNLLEEAYSSLPWSDGRATLNFGPFEIMTLKFEG